MELNDYNNKMDEILNDLTMYRIQRQDLTLKLQNKNNSLVDKLFKMELVSKKDRNKLTTTTALPPRIYGLPKIHKKGTPLRPICSATGSPAHALCKYVAYILKNVTTSSLYNIKNTQDFKEKINNSYIYDDEKMISFDAVSLFPSIPTNLALDIIRNKWTTIEKYTKIPKKMFIEILKFCIKDNRYFKYNETTYTQLKGLPMGSPTSPIIADIVMEELLDNAMNKLARKPRLLTKYVDDLLAIINENVVQNILDALNSFDKNIKFITELEDDGKLPYLDSIVIRRGNQLKLMWYKKSITSGRIINYYSKHPKNMIINTAMGCIRRMMNITDDTYHNDIENEINILLKANDFPDKIIKTLLKRYKSPNSQRREENPKIIKSLTYVPKLSERLSTSDIYNKEDIKIAHKPMSTLKSIFNQTKSKIPQMEKSNIIYQIPCNGNDKELCNKVYVGTTKSKLKMI
ncbi:uncharacterized protein [Eurosta solidaginis]|uniref:uncharacterized protein n=1 Tax=Eurosta solidaginis TaxID=178769 RepID=UPI003531350A